MIECFKGSSSCIKSSSEGYFLDALSSQKNLLIFCKSKGICSTITTKNGYYFNNDFEYYFKCISNSCSKEILQTIYKSNTLLSFYQKDYNVLTATFKNNETNLGKDKKYIPLNYINAHNSNFPEITSGSDTIVLYYENYSLTQYANKGIIPKKKLNKFVIINIY